MRGKAVFSRCFQQTAGITPAHAGKSLVAILEDIRNQDHPRACGEKPPRCPADWSYLGSPPRMRGKGRVRHFGLPSSGITPAHAGKRPNWSFRLQFHKDHPRACGEKDRTIAVQNQPQGSPPRMRGKVRQAGRTVHLPGITPAHAGKSSVFIFGPHVCWDHPRACGEK